MQFNLTRAQVRAMLNLSATKDVRYYLNGLHVVQDARGTIVEATDGHVLGMLRVDDKPHAKPASVIMPTDALKTLRGTKREGDQLIEFSVSGEYVTASRGGTVSTFKAVEGRFPDCRRVTPTNAQLAKDEAPQVAQFNPELLARFVDCATDLGMKGNMAVRPRGNGPALVSIDRDDFVGVVMPWRQETPERVAEWVHAPMEVQVQAPAPVESAEPVAA